MGNFVIMDPDPDAAEQYQSGSVRIQIHNTPVYSLKKRNQW